MKRVPIRDHKSLKKVKPRVCDYILNNDGTEYIETKGNDIRRILVDDLLRQIKEARAQQ